MDKFEIFNRLNGTWEDYEMVAGWQENFVTDKTTDTAIVKLKYNGTEFPKIDIGDWCRLIHSNDGSVSYQSYTELKDYDFVTRHVAWDITYNSDTQNLTKTATITARLRDGITFNVPITVTLTLKEYYTESGGVLPPDTKEVKFIFQPNTSSSENQVVNVNFYALLKFVSIISSPDEAAVSSTNQYITYNIPTDHSQYIVSDISMIKDSPNNEIDIQLNLKEPIEYVVGVLCETRSFSNQTEKKVDTTIYVHKKHTYLSILEDILKTTPANNNLNKSWYSRIKITDKEVLSGTPFNDDTYNEASLYEILMGKYDSGLGRTPVLYFDINATTDLPYNMNRAEYVLRFEKQDGTDKEEIEYSTLENGAGQVLYRKGFDNFAKGIVTNYDNLTTNIQGNVLTSYAFAIPEIDTNERDITGYTNQNGDWVVKVAHNIRNVTKVIKYIYNNQSRQITFSEYDSDNIVTKDQYLASSTLYNSVDAVWYVEGENKIHINEAHYMPITSGLISTDNVNIYAYYVEYNPLVTGRIEIGEEYQVQVNQVDSQINAIQYGEYLKNYLDSMNKSDITITKTVENYEEIYPTGTRVVSNDKKYIITNLSVKNRGVDYEVVYQLNENHIRRNDSIVAPQEIRKNIDIGIDATKERRSALVDVYKLSMTSFNDEQRNINKELVFSPLLNTYSSSNFPKIAILNIKSDLSAISSSAFGGQINTTTQSIERACEIIRFYSANTMWFNLKYYDNAEAGKKKTFQYASIVGGNAVEHVYGTPNQQIPVLYTDAFGEINQFDISFNRGSSDKNITTNPSSWQDFEENILPNLQKSADYPLANISGTSVFDIQGINYKKQRLDSFNYSFGIKIDTDTNIIMCKSFFSNHEFMENNGDAIHTGTHITWIPPYIIKTFDKNVSAEDINTYTPTQTTEVTTCSYNNGEITINLTDTLNSAKCIALCRLNSPMVIIHDYDKYVGGNFNQVKLFC